MKFCFVRLYYGKKYCNIITTFHCQKVVTYIRTERGANEMTQPELILKLIEQLMAEREKNIKLQSQLEEYKKGKD